MYQHMFSLLMMYLQVGCIFSDISDVELENLKTLIWMASRRGVQVVSSEYALCAFLK